MAFSIIASTSKQSTNATSVTTTGINTGGADMIIVVLDCELLDNAHTITDSKSNTWTALTKYNNGARAVRAFICLGPTTDSSHTFSFSVVSPETQPTLHVLAVSGADQGTQPDKSATSQNNQLPSTTPSANNELVITYICTRNTPPLGSAPTGYTAAGTIFNSTANADGGGLAYLIQTTAAATAPLWGANDANRITGLNSFFASTALNISVPKATMTMTTFAPAVTISIPVPLVTMAFTTYAPTVSISIPIPLTTMAFTTYAPVVNIFTDTSVPVATMAFTTYAPAISRNIEVPAATMAFTTYAPGALAGYQVPTTGMALTTYAPVVARGVSVPVRTMAFTTYAPVLAFDRTIEVPTAHLILSEFAPSVFQGNLGPCDDRFGPKIYFWEPSYLDRPEDTFLRATDWDAAGYNGLKFVQGLIIEADTEGQTREILLQGDQADIETITINHNGQVEKPYSLNQPVLKHLLRLLPTDNAFWRLFNVRWVYEPAPEYAREWKTQGTDHDIPGFQFLKDGYIAHASTADITLNITVDDTIFTYTIPHSSGEYVKTYLIFGIHPSGRTTKGTLFTYELTSAEPFQLYQKDCEVRVHDWSGGEYLVKQPFGDISRVYGARI